MTSESHTRTDTPNRRNRRFLVSIWERQPNSNDRTMDGMVWEADPRDPGRIADPAKFGDLKELPTIFRAFLIERQDKR